MIIVLVLLGGSLFAVDHSKTEVVLARYKRNFYALNLEDAAVVQKIYAILAHELESKDDVVRQLRNAVGHL